MKKDYFIFWASEPGEYHVILKITNENKEVTEKTSEKILFDGIKQQSVDTKTKKESVNFFNAILIIAKEIFANKERMVRLSRFDYNLLNKDSYLGKVWGLLNPLIQIGTYWFVFGIGIRNGSPVDGHAFLPWMLSGLIPWFFMSSCVARGASSIFAKSHTVLQLKYPVSTVPVGSILVTFYEHINLLVILTIMLCTFGYYPNFAWINIIYYFIYAIVFLVSLSMVTSVLTMIARDFQKLINAILRLWFYLTPVLWTMGNLPYYAKQIMKLNPAYYVVDGFRQSILYGTHFYQSSFNIGFFWILNILLFSTGCYLQMKFRDRYKDML